MVSLSKPSQRHRISLEKKGGGNLVVKAQWIDNDDGRDDNDDLDLRAGILAPDGSMYWVACSHPGSLDRAPFAKHMGDVQSASADAPGEEIIEVDPDIYRHFGGRVAMVFSVYSAVENGVVSVASLKPRMVMQYGDDRVECAFDFNSGPAGRHDDIYTYVIGVAEFDASGVTIRPSGMVSERGSENTPWLRWEGDTARESMDGPPVFKDGRTLSSGGGGFFGKLFGKSKPPARRYANV